MTTGAYGHIPDGGARSAFLAENQWAAAGTSLLLAEIQVVLVGPRPSSAHHRRRVIIVLTDRALCQVNAHDAPQTRLMGGSDAPHRVSLLAERGDQSCSAVRLHLDKDRAVHCGSLPAKFDTV